VPYAAIIFGDIVQKPGVGEDVDILDRLTPDKLIDSLKSSRHVPTLCHDRDCRTTSSYGKQSDTGG
jgi:hypothetical protein